MPSNTTARNAVASALRIGVLGATDVALRVIVAPAAARSDVVVHAVAASDPARARAWAERHDVSVVHPSYSALLEDDAIGLIYVGLHSSAHAHWAAEAARRGRHVLVEKPMCLTAREAHGLRVASREGGVLVTEAVMTAGHPWQDLVARAVRTGRDGSAGGGRDGLESLPAELGRLVAVETEIAFGDPGDGYRARPELGGGILLDAAPYWLQALQATCGLEVRSLDGCGAFTGAHGADEWFRAELVLNDGGADGGVVRARLEARSGQRHRATHRFQFAGGGVTLRHFLRPAAAAVPLNLVVQHAGGREVRSLPGPGYYAAQLDRVLAAITAGDLSGAAFEQAAVRVTVADDLYRRALPVAVGWAAGHPPIGATW